MCRIEDIARSQAAFLVPQLLERGLDAFLRQRFLGTLHDTCCTRIRLQAAPAATTALAGIGHLNLHVPQLGAMAMFPLDHQVANDDAAADTGAERKEHHAMDVAASTSPELAERRGIGVILEC